MACGRLASLASPMYAMSVVCYYLWFFFLSYLFPLFYLFTEVQEG
jgi:hypothetical protein